MIQKAYKASVIQMNSQDNLDHNLEQAYHLIKKAVTDNVTLVGLPENFAFLGDLSRRLEEAETISEKASDFLEKTSREFAIYLMGGSYPVPAGNGKVYNHCRLYSPAGEVLAQYNKIHLFDVTLSEQEAYRESEYVQPGEVDSVVCDDEVIGCMGLSICYDLRFPEYYRSLTLKGAEILSIPAAFTYTTGRKHWEVLLKARAVENTSFVFAPAQTGLHGEKRRTFGHSVIIDPDGKILAQAGEETGIATAVIEPESIKKARKSIPSLTHRRM